MGFFLRMLMINLVNLSLARALQSHIYNFGFYMLKSLAKVGD